MGILISFISQAFPPKPTFTEKDIGNLEGKASTDPVLSKENEKT